VVLAISVHTAHRLQEVGILIAGLGAICLIIVGVLGQRRVTSLASVSPMAEYVMMIVAGVLLGIGFLIELIGVHG
jgi:uncharacterized membrane protein